ncbi:hypothetical protein [Amycolatopsis jejuensis]|uniref:hypothetical protein n=1 Tax=Amycolatopsis jejuensis TaxID=330084 RepID=UPI0012E04FB0|nr:hypothetical protein [Amycolatopsis jejuensis]
MIGIFIEHGFTTGWFRLWWLRLAAAAFSLLAYPIVKEEGAAAGAEWVMFNRAWVRLYELTSVRAYSYGNTLNIHLVDHDGRKLQTSIDRLQDDRRIWDLTYNGILHSIVKNGADSNQLARGTLNLPATS